MDANIVRSGLRHEVTGWMPARPRRAPPAPGYDHAPAAACSASTEANRSDVAQPLHPLDPHPLAVQVAVEVEQVRLEDAPAVLEGGLGPLVHHPAGPAAAPLDPHRVDPVGRQQLLRRHVGQVDRRDARSAARAARPGPPARSPGTAGRACRAARGEVAAGHRPADPRAGDVLLADIHRRHHVHLEPALGAQPAQGLDVAAPAPAEAVVVPDHQLPHLAARRAAPRGRTPRASARASRRSNRRNST